jgi:hypothetical protein
MNDELSADLAAHARWAWAEGMRDHLGRRIVDLALVTPDLRPDLSDAATGGCLLAALDDLGVLTDVVRSEGEWIVAVELPSDLKGFAADHLAEAAAWALLEAWAELGPPQLA